MVPLSKPTKEVRRNRGYAKGELVFQVEAPPLGYTTYFISLLRDETPEATNEHGAPPSIQNKVTEEYPIKISVKGNRYTKQTNSINLLYNLCFSS